MLNLIGGISLFLATEVLAEQATPQEILLGIKYLFPKVSKVGVIYSSEKEEAYELQDLGTEKGYEVLIGFMRKAKEIKGIYNGMYRMGIKVLVLLGTDTVFEEALPFLVRASRRDFIPVIGSEEEHVKKGLPLAMVRSSDGKLYIAVNERICKKFGIRFGEKVLPLVRPVK